MNIVLLLVDLQRDFLGRPCLVPSAGEVTEKAAALLGTFREAGGPVVHLRTSVSRDPDLRMPHWREKGCWTCEEGSAGARPPAELEEHEGERVLLKQGYGSGQLEATLDGLRPDAVVVAGVMLHACVREAVLALHAAGHRVLVAEDATGSDDPIHAAATRRFLETRGIRFAASNRLWEECRGDAPGEGEDAATRIAEAVSAAREEIAARESDREARFPPVDRLADRLEEAADSLAETMARELGKPVTFGRVEVLRSAEMLRAVARRLSNLSAGDSGEAVQVRRRPLGVVAVVTPWNNPVYLSLGKIAPAVLCGNAVVWKPSPKAEPVSRELERLMRECGWPSDLVRRIEGDGAVARGLMRAEGVDGVTITGSQGAGFDAAEASLHRCIPLQAELGGNNAAIVWSDADLAMAAGKIVAGAFDQAGQRCTANRRVIVERAICDEFLDLLVSRTRELAWGDPLDEATRIGPLVDEPGRERVDGVVRRAISGGARVIRPLGERPGAEDGDGRAWYPPTLVFAEDSGGEIVQEETFGPVLVVQPADDWDDAIGKLNGVRQGLAAALFTRSVERIDRFHREAQAGLLKVDDSTADAAVDVPFGGWKASGIGPPEHGDADREFYTRTQVVYGPGRAG